MLNFSAGLVLGLGILLQSEAPSDVPRNHWAFGAVDDLFKAGILHGYPDKSMHGDKAVSNYEMAATLKAILDSIEHK